MSTEDKLKWIAEHGAQLFHVEVRLNENAAVSLPSLTILSGENMERLRRKMPLVQEAATRLAVGMLKGTIKYDTDDWTPEQWIEHLGDEAFDQVNYFMLLKAELASLEASRDPA